MRLLCLFILTFCPPDTNQINLHKVPTPRYITDTTDIWVDFTLSNDKKRIYNLYMSEIGRYVIEPHIVNRKVLIERPRYDVKVTDVFKKESLYQETDNLQNITTIRNPESIDLHLNSVVDLQIGFDLLRENIPMKNTLSWTIGFTFKY